MLPRAFSLPGGWWMTGLRAAGVLPQVRVEMESVEGLGWMCAAGVTWPALRPERYGPAGE